MSNWLFGKKTDLFVLFAPVWVCWIVAFLLPNEYLLNDTPLWIWVVIVIGIDVSHVWSSIHRTYLDKEEFANHRRVLYWAPILSFALAFGVAAISIDWFWRCLAYVAVYHFVKQQFGFMRIYKAKMKDFRKKFISDDFVIYLSMLYPVVYWHLNPGRNFAWFVEGDFFSISLKSPLMFQIGNVVYFLILTFWLVEEFRNSDKIPTGKVLWVLTTAGNWFLGIVYFNSDLVFTVTNVIAHGVPYLALIVIYQIRKQDLKNLKLSLVKRYSLSFWIISSVLLLAFAEEYLWDLLVYRENEPFFSQVVPYFSEIESSFWQWLFIGLLAVPQITHYILDGFIWKNNEKNPYLKEILLN